MLCHLLYYLGEINSGIHMNGLLVFGYGYGFRFAQQFWCIDRVGEKKAQVGGFAYPYSPPSFCFMIYLSNVAETVRVQGSKLKLSDK